MTDAPYGGYPATDRPLEGTSTTDAAKESGTIRGDLPVSASLSRAWQALFECLKDIQRRATSFPATGSGSSAEPAAGSSAGASAGDPDAPDSGSAA